MPPIPFHTYKDTRGDTITYKFDPDIARNPNPDWPHDSAVSVYHSFETERFFHSRLLSLEAATKRWREDKQSLQPVVGKVMYEEVSAGEDEAEGGKRVQYVWKGWGHGEGYRRGWARVAVVGPRDGGVVVTVPCVGRG